MPSNELWENKFGLKWTQMTPFDFCQKWKVFELSTI
jgi:hypothetical protein